MTRINCVPPEELTRQHLVAEYRELPRIFGLVRQAIARGIRSPRQLAKPQAYCLGRGPMLFFYDKLGFLVERQTALIAERRRRGYAPSFTDPQSLLEGIPATWHGRWSPTPEALAISRQRLAERNGQV